MEDTPGRLIHSYGRRRGRPLRSGRATLVDELLPRLSIPAPEPGTGLDPADLFSRRPASVWLEIGFGGGEHLAAQAEAHRDIGFIGAEPYLNGVAGLLARIHEARLDNIRLWPNDVRMLLPAFPPGSIGRAFVLFPDPWPKARHHKRRLIAKPFLDDLARVLIPGGEFRVATDDPDYQEWILENLAAHPAFAGPAGAADERLRRPADWPSTRYEAKAIAAGRRPIYLAYTRRP
jgi:tRNA (guanine-N7-)-methyltransferase